MKDVREEVLVSGPRGLVEFLESRGGRLRVARLAERLQGLDLILLELRRDLQALGGRSARLVELQRVDADDLAAPLLDVALPAVGGFLDLALRDLGLDELEHAALGLDLRELRGDARVDLVGQRLDRPRARDGVHGVGHAGLVRENLLRAQRERRGLLGRERQRLVGPAVSGCSGATVKARRKVSVPRSSFSRRPSSSRRLAHAGAARRHRATGRGKTPWRRTGAPK